MIKKKKRIDSPFIFQTFVIQDCFNNVSFTNVYRMVLLNEKSRDMSKFFKYILDN